MQLTRFKIYSSLPNPEIGEHLLSTLGRYYLLSGHNAFTRSVARITQDKHVLNPSLPSRRAYTDIVDIIGSCNKASDLFKNHTPINYYTAFSPNVRTQSNIPLGFYNVNNTNFWRWCPHCVSEDRDSIGFSYYHLKHQLPCVFRCYKHNSLLVYRCSSCNSVWEKINRLPTPPTKNSCPYCAHSFETPKDIDLPALEWLQSTSWSILEGSTVLPSVETLRKLYRLFIGIDNNHTYTLAERKKFTEAQSYFEEKIGEKTMKAIFKNAFQKNGRTKSKTLYLSKAAFDRDAFLPPVVHLLIIWVIYGGIEPLLKDALKIERS